MKSKHTIIASSGGSYGEHYSTYINPNPKTLIKGAEYYPRQTGQIDELIISASGKKSPKVCCIMTASDGLLNNISNKITALKRRFTDCGAEVEFMRLSYYAPDDQEVKAQIESADIIYVAGGTSYILNKTLKKRGVDKLLLQATSQGTILSGLSAGLCCWFSDINSSTSGSILRTKGQGWFKAYVAPHWDVEDFRHQPFHRTLIDDPGLVGLAFEDHTAIEIRDGQYRIHEFADGGNVYRALFDNKTGSYHFEPLKITTDFKPLTDIGISCEI